MEYKEIVDTLFDSLKNKGIRIHMYHGSYLEPKCEVDTKEHDKEIENKTVGRMRTILEFEIKESVLIPKAVKTFLKDIILKVVEEMKKY